VAVRQGGRLIQKKELGIPAWRHDLTVSPAEFQPTGDPAAHLPVAHNRTPIVVQNATVAHQRAASRYGNDFA
jgi:hypothetical protein